MKVSNTDYVQMLYDYDIDVRNNIFILNNGIDDGSLDLVIKALTIFQGEPCTMILNSGGGDVHAGLAMYDLIRAHGKVMILVTGVVNSMAAIVLQAGSLRRITEHSTMMIHQGYIQPDAESSKNIKAYVKLSDSNDEKCDKILLEKIQEKVPGYSWAKLRKTTQFDNYLNASQAVAVGLADEVIP